jgi:hypothetical protein
MTRRKPTPEREDDKGEGSDDSPMDRFKNLARRVVNVSNRRVMEERAKEERAKDRARARKK